MILRRRLGEYAIIAVGLDVQSVVHQAQFEYGAFKSALKPNLMNHSDRVGLSVLKYRLSHRGARLWMGLMRWGYASKTN